MRPQSCRLNAGPMRARRRIFRSPAKNGTGSTFLRRGLDHAELEWARITYKRKPACMSLRRLAERVCRGEIIRYASRSWRLAQQVCRAVIPHPQAALAACLGPFAGLHGNSGASSGFRHPLHDSQELFIAGLDRYPGDKARSSCQDGRLVFPEPAEDGWPPDGCGRRHQTTARLRGFPGRQSRSTPAFLFQYLNLQTPLSNAFPVLETRSCSFMTL